MGLFSRLSNNVKKKRANEIIGKSERKSKVRFEKLSAISTSIIQVSTDCSSSLKTFIEEDNDVKKRLTQVFVFYEFIYFFLHMTIRTASSGVLTESQIKNLQEFLGSVIPDTAIDYYFRQWPEDDRQKLKSDFFDRLNLRELQYSSKKSVVSTGKYPSSDNLFGALSENVCEVAFGGSPATMFLLVYETAVREFITMKFQDLISNAADVL